MKNISKINQILSPILAVLAFMAVFSIAGQANANYYGYNNYGYDYGYSNSSNSYSPVYYSSANPVYYPTPTPIYYPMPTYIPISYPVYQTPVYQNYQSLQVSCYPNTTSVRAGDTVTWYASVSGGNGYYSYGWSGTDNLYGSNSTVSRAYYGSGVKYAYVTVASDGQNVTQACNNQVSVNDIYASYNGYNVYPAYGTNYYQPGNVASPYVAYSNTTSNNSGLDIACYADPTTASVNQPVTWTAEVTGGVTPYTYSWTGSGGLTGSQASVIKYYSTSGDKSAIVTATSADNKTSTRACSNSVTVHSGSGYSASSNGLTIPAKYQPYIQPVQQSVQPQPQVQQPQGSQPNNSALSAASLFSLANVPWGWVAVLIILVLFATVLYLLFNRTKI